MADTAPNLSAGIHPVSTSLHIALDDLWIQYLSLLDQYQGLRQELAKDLASGHFDLAKANFSNPHRIRYGKDFYDERMQASSRVSCTLEHFFTLNDFTLNSEKDSSEGDQPKIEGSEVKKSASPKDHLIGKNDETEISKVDPIAKDPLLWFGVLVPPTLRKSQSAFKNAVGKSVKLAAVDKEMKAIEIEIRRTRKKLKKATE